MVEVEWDATCSWNTYMDSQLDCTFMASLASSLIITSFNKEVCMIDKIET